jgi:hypothetical protein
LIDDLELEFDRVINNARSRLKTLDAPRLCNSCCKTKKNVDFYGFTGLCKACANRETYQRIKLKYWSK